MNGVIVKVLCKSSSLARAMRSREKHVERGHTRFGRDCRICLESAKARPHWSIPNPLRPLSIDITGPLQYNHQSAGHTEDGPGAAEEQSDIAKEAMSSSSEPW